MSSTLSFSELKAEWMNDPEFREAYEIADMAIQLGIQVRELRCGLKLSKRELARLAGVPAAAITRIELGSSDVRLQSVTRLSKALGTRLVVELVTETAI